MAVAIITQAKGAAAPPPLLPSISVDGEVHLVEAWPGSVTIHHVDDPGAVDWIHGFILDVAGDFPERMAGVLFLLAPHEVAAQRASMAGRST